MPADDGVGRGDPDAASPVWPQPRQQYRQQAIDGTRPGSPSRLALEDGELMPEREDLPSSSRRDRAQDRRAESTAMNSAGMLRRTVSVSTHIGNDGNRYRISGGDRPSPMAFQGGPPPTAELISCLPQVSACV
jgi:hypothetical protein